MTVAIALQVHDGVVFASDSAITLTDPTKTGPESVLNVYGNGNKIFNIVKGLPIGGVFYGMANIGSSSISTLIKDLRRKLSGDEQSSGKSMKLNKNNYTIEGVAKLIRKHLYDDHFQKLVPLPANPQFGFLVGGYSSGAQLSEVWSFTINAAGCSEPNLVLAQGVSNCVVGGDPDAFQRLVNGHSAALMDVLLKENIDAVTAGKVAQIAREKLALSLVEPAMPIQDAIDLAEFIVTTTSQLARFKRGSATVGGPTESAAITKHEGFRWVHRKHYFSRDLNPGEFK